MHTFHPHSHPSVGAHKLTLPNLELAFAWRSSSVLCSQVFLRVTAWALFRAALTSWSRKQLLLDFSTDSPTSILLPLVLPEALSLDPVPPGPGALRDLGVNPDAASF